MFLGFLSSPRGKRRFADQYSPSRGKAKAQVTFQAGLEALEGRELLALLPNLVPDPNYLKDAHIVTINNGYYLEFSAVTANVGTGQLELRHSGIFYTYNGIQYEEAIQRIYDNNINKVYKNVNLDPHGTGDGVGDFDVAGEYHWFNLYELKGSNGTTIAQYKATCNVGDDFLWKQLPGSPSNGVYTYTDSSGNKVQGLSVGWADEYNGNYIYLGTTVPANGTYTLTQTVNPDGVIHESSTSDNKGSVTVTISGGTVTSVQ